MRLPPVGWAFLVLAVIFVVGYLLIQGVFVGSRVQMGMRGNGQPAYFHECRYLYFSGIREMLNAPVAFETSQEAESQVCQLLGNSN